MKGTKQRLVDMKVKKAAVAMSGGVDSSVAALLLKQQGYEVAGINMNLFSTAPGQETIGVCCSEESSSAARAVCDILGIPFFCLNFHDVFEKEVIQPFVDEYLAGRTPNPCVECNRRVKFGSLLNKVVAMGFDSLATGHYARICSKGAERQLLKGIDRGKDQSYFLYMLGQRELGRLLLPNGELTKKQVRKIAEEAGLPSADREESQEICFIRDDTYGGIINTIRPGRVTPGPIFDLEGRRIGEHRGIVNYTIGQRRGLGVSAPEPIYVVEVRPEENAVVAGGKDALFSRGLDFEDACFVCGAPADGEGLQVKIRYNASPASAVYRGVVPDEKPDSDSGVFHRIIFDKPQRSVAPGQAVVLYSGDRVIGGGKILRPIK